MLEDDRFYVFFKDYAYRGLLCVFVNDYTYGGPFLYILLGEGLCKECCFTMPGLSKDIWRIERIVSVYFCEGLHKEDHFCYFL